MEKRVSGIVPQPTADPRLFLLPSAPDPPASLQLFLNGILQEPGEEFELSGNEIHFLADVYEHDRQRAWYTEAG